MSPADSHENRMRGILWMLATMLCFALLDPLAISAGEAPAWWTGRLRVYAIGFFFFWLIGLIAAALCWQLSRPGQER